MRCDIESLDYSYSFSAELEQEWEWTERYPAGPEILAYLNHVADRFDLRRDIELNAHVTRVHYDDAGETWHISTDDGASYSATHCVMASGCLSSVHRPQFDGLDDFRGDWYHTARWPADGVDLSGKRVGIIGTGSTGIQLIPQFAEQAGHLYVFQRTANFSMPAHNGPLDPAMQRAAKAAYPRAPPARPRVAQRRAGLAPGRAPAAVSPRSRRAPSAPTHSSAAGPRAGIGGVTLAFNDINVDPEANALAADFVRSKIRQIVTDPAVAEAAVPDDVSDRLQAHVRRHRLLRDLQPPQRHARRCAQRADRADHDGRHRDDGRGVRARRDRLRHRLRRDHRRPARDRHPRPRRPLAARQVGRRSRRVSRSRRGRLPEPVPRDRSGQPVGAEQHGLLDRAARRLDRGLHRAT